MKTSKLLKTITVAGALAATLSLSACDMHISFGQEDTRQDETSANPEEAGTEPTETVAEESAPDSDVGQESTTANDSTTSSDSTSASDSGTAGTSTSSGTSTSAGTDTDSSTSTSTADSDSGASGSGSSGSGSSGSGSSSGEGTGSEGVNLDQQGNGTIPANDLETDIRNAYADKGVYVDLVECRYDLKIIAKRGSTNCEVTDNGKTHYGTVKVTSVTSAGVGYQLEFPNIS